MVSYKAIKAANALINDATAPRVAVFVGGTSGIGQQTIMALVATGASVKIYLVGRKASEERSGAFIEEQRAVNPHAEIIWVEAEIALLADSKKACETILAKESRLDLLFLTAGYAPFGGRVETAEGIEITQSLEYYGRILFVQHLLPLLIQAEAPRVVSVLGGGLEGTNNVDLDDLGLKKPGNFGPVKAQTQFVTMNTMALDKLAHDNPSVTFIHSWPGWVNTGNARRGSDPKSFIGLLIRLFLEPVIGLFSFSLEESGQRYLFQSTSAAFGGRGVTWTGKPGVASGSGDEDASAVGSVVLVGYKCDCTPNAKVVAKLREKAQEKIWQHTQEVLAPYL